MKKTIFLGIIILSLLCGVIVGYFFVTGGEKVLEKKDILVYQASEKLELYNQEEIESPVELG